MRRGQMQCIFLYLSAIYPTSDEIITLLMWRISGPSKAQRK